MSWNVGGGRVAGEELVVRRDTGELNHTELHDQVVDELLSLILGKSALVQVAQDIDVEECRDTAYRHRSTILSLHSSEVTEVQPLNSLPALGSLSPAAALSGRRGRRAAPCASAASF